MAQVGDYIGNYRLVEVVNSGTFGQVFRAEHRWLTGRQVAIKFLRLERLHNPHEREQFLHEARILNQLKHPAILPILDFGLENEFPYIITEYASGGTLRAYLRKDAGKPLDLADVLRIIVPIGEALQYAHENRIVHRDLKPENILFDAHNRPLLADFGIAIVLTTNTSYLGSIGGTAPYMAPEQFKGKAYPESDQYASGCLLYEMLTGRRPFQAPFHGGQDAQPNGVIQQSDIDGAAKSLSTQLTTSTQAALRKQVQSNERVVDGSFQCNPTTTANHKAGDHTPSVTVSVSVACSEEVFDFTGAQRMTSSLLMTNLPSGVDLTGYKPVGQIITSLVSATVVSGANQVNVNMQAAARWVYQFGNQEQP